MSIIVNLFTFYLCQGLTTKTAVKTMSSIDFISIGVLVMTMRIVYKECTFIISYRLIWSLTTVHSRWVVNFKKRYASRVNNVYNVMSTAHVHGDNLRLSRPWSWLPQCKLLHLCSVDVMLERVVGIFTTRLIVFEDVTILSSGFHFLDLTTPCVYCEVFKYVRVRIR